MSETTPNDPKIGPAEQSRGEAELIGRIIQSEQKLTDYFTTIIIKNVTDQLERRAMMRLRIIGLVVASLLTVAIPGVMSWVRGALSSSRLKQPWILSSSRQLRILREDSRSFSTRSVCIRVSPIISCTCLIVYRYRPAN